jgi:hypothetical protein
MTFSKSWEKANKYDGEEGYGTIGYREKFGSGPCPSEPDYGSPEYRKKFQKQLHQKKLDEFGRIWSAVNTIDQDPQNEQSVIDALVALHTDEQMNEGAKEYLRTRVSGDVPTFRRAARRNYLALARELDILPEASADDFQKMPIPENVDDADAYRLNMQAIAKKVTSHYVIHDPNLAWKIAEQINTAAYQKSLDTNDDAIISQLMREHIPDFRDQITNSRMKLHAYVEELGNS